METDSAAPGSAATTQGKESQVVSRPTGADGVKAKDRAVVAEANGPIFPMDHYNVTEFLRGQSSKIFTKMAREDKAAYIQKNGKPLVVAISNDRFERLLRKGININEY